MIRILSSGIVGVFFCAAAASANTQVPCAERSEVADKLHEQFGEEVRAVGMNEAGGVVEVYVSPDRTWTMVLSLPSGLTCFVQSGDAWEWLAPGKRDPHS